jgi:hypothetical protein
MSSAGPFAAARLRVGCARTQGRGGEGEREGACFSRRRWVEENPLRPGPMKTTRLAFLLLRVDARSFSAASVCRSVRNGVHSPRSQEEKGVENEDEKECKKQEQLLLGLSRLESHCGGGGRGRRVHRFPLSLRPSSDSQHLSFLIKSTFAIQKVKKDWKHLVLIEGKREGETG